MHVVKLTPGQFEAADWAIDGMKDCEVYLSEEEYGYTLPLPAFDFEAGTKVPNLLVPDDENTIADFLYRLEEQAPHMSDVPKAWIDTTSKLASKIRTVTKFNGTY